MNTRLKIITEDEVTVLHQFNNSDEIVDAVGESFHFEIDEVFSIGKSGFKIKNIYIELKNGEYTINLYVVSYLF